MRARRIRALAAVVGAIASVSAAVALPAQASASVDQLSIIQDSNHVLSDPAGTLATIRALGVSTVRVIVVWAQIAPNWEGRTAPRNFNAADPAAYPAGNWAPYDTIVKLASADGIAVDFTLSGGAPLWAEGPGIPRAALDNQYWAWRPSAQAFGQFVRAMGERYSGTYVPRGQTAPLPRVSFWAIWNEPNFGEDLGPQAIAGSTVPTGPVMYRSLVGQAWNSLQATGHGADTILIGEFAPWGLAMRGTPKRPQGLPGQFGQTKPLSFLRTLYCVDSSYRPLQGSAARSVRCPTTAAGSRAFWRNNPGLFDATGLADHPYPHALPKDMGGGGFASGLLFSTGQAKATYAAYRLPLFLPANAGRRGRALEVWGCVRPARYEIFDTGSPQSAQIQFAPRGGGFTTLQTVLVSDPADCYFDLRIKFPSSGTVRVAYTYPTVGAWPAPVGTTVYSRSVAVTIR